MKQLTLKFTQNFNQLYVPGIFQNQARVVQNYFQCMKLEKAFAKVRKKSTLIT